MSGVTDALLHLAACAGASRVDDALARVQQLRERHLATARALVPGLASLFADIEAQFDELTAVVKALAVLREVSPRTLDVIAAMGELLSSRIVAAALVEARLPAEWVDARQAIVTNDEFTRATPIAAATNEALRATVRPLLDAGCVPVVGGFVGSTASGHTTTLGRGGSDYSGALVGAGTGAAEIQIWTDVDGMLTADPRIISEPRLVPRLSFAEAAELAYFGAKVLHPSTILPAIQRNIPVRILNSRNSNGPGTLITADPPAAATAADGARRQARCHGGGHHVEPHADGVWLPAPGVRGLRALHDGGRRGDHLGGERVGHRGRPPPPRRDRRGAGEIAEVSVEHEMALLCAVGDRLRNEPAIAAKVVSVLEEVPLRMISQAASRRNITVILRQADLSHAMHRLHEEFFSDRFGTASG